MRLSGIGDLVLAIEPIYPNPVISSAQIAVMREMTAGSLSGLGCDCEGGNMTLSGIGRLGLMPNVMWPELDYEDMQGRDIRYEYTGIAGLGDFVPASYPVPQNPIAAGGGTGNGLVNALAGLQGLGAIDLSSASAFVTSVETGTTSVFGMNVPNWALIGGGVALLFMVGGKSGGRRR